MPAPRDYGLDGRIHGSSVFVACFCRAHGPLPKSGARVKRTVARGEGGRHARAHEIEAADHPRADASSRAEAGALLRSHGGSGATNPGGRLVGGKGLRAFVRDTF